MGQQTPLFASERTAAQLLDMKLVEFRALVQAGALPGPTRLDRWDVSELQAIMRGQALFHARLARLGRCAACRGRGHGCRDCRRDRTQGAYHGAEMPQAGKSESAIEAGAKTAGMIE